MVVLTLLISIFSFFAAGTGAFQSIHLYYAIGRSNAATLPALDATEARLV